MLYIFIWKLFIISKPLIQSIFCDHTDLKMRLRFYKQHMFYFCVVVSWRRVKDVCKRWVTISSWWVQGTTMAAYSLVLWGSHFSTTYFNQSKCYFGRRHSCVSSFLALVHVDQVSGDLGEHEHSYLNWWFCQVFYTSRSLQISSSEL